MDNSNNLEQNAFSEMYSTQNKFFRIFGYIVIVIGIVIASSASIYGIFTFTDNYIYDFTPIVRTGNQSANGDTTWYGTQIEFEGNTSVNVVIENSSSFDIELILLTNDGYRSMMQNESYSFESMTVEKNSTFNETIEFGPGVWEFIFDNSEYGDVSPNIDSTCNFSFEITYSEPRLFD